MNSSEPDIRITDDTGLTRITGSSLSSRLVLPLAFAAIIVLMASVASIAILRIAEINRSMSDIVNDHNVKTQLVIRLYNAARERSVILLSMVNMEDPFEREQEFDRFNALGTEFALARIAFGEMVLDDTEQGLMEEQLERVQETIPLQEEVLALLVDDKFDAAFRLLRAEAIPSQNRVLEQLRLMLDYQQTKARAALEGANENYETSVVYIILLALVAAAISFIIAIVVIKKTRDAETTLREVNVSLERRVVERTEQLASQTEELKQVRDEAVRANRHKSEFLANMSHELRTPLNAIIGFSEVLKEKMFGDLNDKQNEYVEDIHTSGRHLLSLINDILDLSKIEAGRMELDITAFDLRAAIENALTLVKERAARHGITLESHIEDRIGEFRGDERKFKQIMLNLLSNAIKFTPDGGRVSVWAVDDQGAVKISVQDTGVGIAPQDLERVFEEFRQVGDSGEMKQQGTGLGLSLTRTFVEMHGGKIAVESEPGTGSKFTFTLPLSAR